MMFEIGQEFDQDIESEDAVETMFNALRAGSRHSVKAIDIFGHPHYASVRVLAIRRLEMTTSYSKLSGPLGNVQKVLHSYLVATMIVVDLPAESDMPNKDGGK